MATATDKQRPRLKNLDDLFMLNQDAMPQPNAELPSPATKRFQAVVDLDRLIPFAGHPFHLYEGERLDDMVESIRNNGVLVPIIAREKGNQLEILAGHNRVNASRLAGMTAIPAILLKDVSDEEAWIYVVETNLMQRSFADMSHSEKAAVISIQHSKMFSQGKRNDILAELKRLESPQQEKDGTSRQVGEQSHSDELVATMYGLSSRVVSRYLRIHKLIAPLKTMLDVGDIAFIPAVTLSFLKEQEQVGLAKCVELNGFSVDMKKADVLRDYSGKGKLDDDRIYLILNGELGQKQKPNRTPVVKVNKAVYSKYFQPNQSAKEVQDIVEKALEMYFSQ
ncbi:ParB N-terminal domain-containing protein [Ruminococcaceae bacterium OttesenSCG-928-A16]|nr:ParB N-terminal domain-containing protein [Clostridia bacterium OttesenSCG-928-F22]MDL2324387.1 ParB N-terminal domain-containing protein [Ruminococcaceae bacterium OttesenSCG-928-A16]